MKLNVKKNKKVNRIHSQSIFEINQEELQHNLLRYNIEKNRVNNSIANMDFKNYWVI
jgi:hypothetical protein